VLGLLLVLAGELAWAVRSDGLAYDELTLVASGYWHLTTGDAGFNPEHPPLAKLLGALPLLALRPAVPETQPGENHWSFGHRFFHVANDADRLVPLARIPSVLLTLALAVLLWRWSRAAHGVSAGIGALALAAFQPSLLAHGHVATTDLPATFLMVAASWLFWRWSLAPGLGRGLIVAAIFVLAAAARHTTWVLIPGFALLLALGRANAPRPSLRKTAILALTFLVAFPLVLGAVYAFDLGPARGIPALPAAVEWLLALLPRNYVGGAMGFFSLAALEQPYPVYLLGRISEDGWRAYHVVALAAKSTPGFLLALVAGAAALIRRRPSRGDVETHWLVPAVLVLLSASLSRVQTGERYALGMHPYLILLAARAVPWALSSTGGRVLLAVTALLHIGPSLDAARGGYLPYFNVFAGGTHGGHRILTDSNLDWGQDLPRLADWMRRRGVDRIQLGYFGKDDPRRFGIRHKDLPGSHGCAAGLPRHPFTGVVVVSPNLVLSHRPQGDPYAALRGRPPDERAGVFFVYRFPPP